MKALMTWILSVLLCLCVCTGNVVRHHHHTSDGHFCLCLNASDHSKQQNGNDIGHDGCDHNDDPRDCQRSAFNLTCDQPLRHFLQDLPQPMPAIETDMAPLTTQQQTEETRTNVFTGCVPAPLRGCAHPGTRRGPPCR